MNQPLPKIEDFDDPLFDPFVTDEVAFGDMANPYPRIAELRRQASVHETGYNTLMGFPPDVTLTKFKHYSVFGYEDVEKVLTDPETFTNEAYKHNLGITFGQTISLMDGPRHAAIRRIVQRAFLPNIVAKWSETLVDPVINELIEKFEKRGTADLVQEFTHYYPLNIIYRQIGLPQEDIKVFHRLAIGQTVVAVDPEHGMEASRKLGVYFKEMIAQRRANPGDDLVSMLATVEVEGEKLPEDVVISFFRQLINAGADTTFRGTSILFACLLSNPDQLEAVRKDRDLIPQAIEEALRWDGPVLVQSRWCARETELGGVKIPAGSVIDVVAGSANRDENFWPNPDKFDIFRDRGKSRHFSFSAGPHVCAGQHLARLEMTRALNAVLDRLPNLRLDPKMPPPDIRGVYMRIPKHIYVHFDT